MKLIDLIQKLSAIASSYGADAEVLIETGNLNHVEFEFDTKTKKVVVIRLDMSCYEEAQEELAEDKALAKELEEPIGIPSSRWHREPYVRCPECDGNIDECECEG